MLLKKKKSNTKVSLKLTKKLVKKKIINFNVGDLITIGILSNTNNKNRIYEIYGLIIAKKKKDINQRIILCSNIKGILVENYFLISSPNILFIKIHYFINIKVAKIYFLR